VRDLESSAIKNGWKRVHAGWACPVCAPAKNQITPLRFAK
jgi:rubredoxin